MSTKEDLIERIDAVRDSETWGYHSRASSKFRYVTVATPKVGCSTLKRALHALEGLPFDEQGNLNEDRRAPRLASFTTAETVEMLTSPDWLRFCIVRDPYERLFSAWKSKIGNSWDTQYLWLRDEIRGTTTGEFFPLPPFRDFVRHIVSTNTRARHDGHIIQQVKLLRTSVIPYDVIGRFESYADDLRAILERLGAPADVLALATEKTNATVQIPLAAAYDDELADLVYDHYRVDFEAFGYARDSWRSNLGAA